MLKCRFCGSEDVSIETKTNKHEEGDQVFTCSYQTVICNNCFELNNREQLQHFHRKISLDLYNSNRPHQALKLAIRASGQRPTELAKFSHVPALLLKLQTIIPIKLPLIDKVWRLIFALFKTQEQKISPDWNFTYRTNTQLAKRPS